MTITRDDFEMYRSGDDILPFDNEASGPFVTGETITGGTSGATATVEGVHDADGDSTDDTLRISNVSGGPFQNNEQITGGTSGATADVDSVPGEIRNNDPNLMLGGEVSTSPLSRQIATVAGVPVSGITLAYSVGHVDDDLNFGVNTIFWDQSASTMRYTTQEQGAGAIISVTADGRYILPTNDLESAVYVVIDVVFASLPGSDATLTVNTANVDNDIWDDKTALEVFVGDVDYRCIYLHNASGTDTFFGVGVYVEEDPAFGEVTVGLDPAGIGDGLTTGVATRVTDELSAPAGVTFSKPTTAGSALVVGDLAPGEYQALWLRRTNAGSTAPQASQQSQLRIVLSGDFP